MVISFGTCSGSGLFSGRLAEQKYHNETHLFLKTAISRGTSEKLFFFKIYPPGGELFFVHPNLDKKKRSHVYVKKRNLKKRQNAKRLQWSFFKTAIRMQSFLQNVKFTVRFDTIFSKSCLLREAFVKNQLTTNTSKS